MSSAIHLSASSAATEADLFKGIALFTPAGDVVYCIDTDKRSRWHTQLCTTLQELLGLPEIPHFLLPCYSATVDRWLNPRTQQVETYGEAGPAILRYQALLNCLFQTRNLVWRLAPNLDELCDPMVLENYREQFPQLWHDHDLIVRIDQPQLPERSPQSANTTLAWTPNPSPEDTSGYVLRLFVSRVSPATERTLRDLHQLLERSLKQPYTLKVVDIHKHPELAEVDHISATPTLVKAWPLPVRRLVGDLGDANRILHLLGTPDIPQFEE